MTSRKFPWDHPSAPVNAQTLFKPILSKYYGAIAQVGSESYEHHSAVSMSFDDQHVSGSVEGETLSLTIQGERLVVSGFGSPDAVFAVDRNTVDAHAIDAAVAPRLAALRAKAFSFTR